ncbi:uncharacterized protein LOC123654500 [Melitaea cinxia]|uniref:uncharacterized protein LOC123654500 n=1 Tax=Melitaea cinxia TaxID=113334 RepID=UPI001E2700D7|nr:uncharacterized protein LOC123654500 [Melitaea cinxia]
MADKLIKRRSSMKAKLTSFSNYLEIVKSCEILSELQIIELESRFDKYNALYSEYDELQTEIETLADKPEEAYAMRTQFEEQYYALLAVARSLLNKGSKRRDSAGSVTGSEASMTGRTKNNFIRLPKINLPHFDGSYQCWLEYRDTFNSLIHENTCIDDINKFHYLRASLKGTAAEIIKNIDFKGDNYIIAWNLICERYNNNRLLINNHVQALFNVEPLSTESSVSLRRLVDVTNKNIRALKTLNEPTEHWDTLIIYMMSIKLDLHTSRKWEEYRNTLADNSPTLSQFCTFINNTADLLETLQDNIKHNKTLYTNKLEKNNNTKSFIVTSENSKGKNTSANNSKFKCPMCSGKHFLYSCESYRKLPIESRIQKAKDFKVCMNCLRIGHVEKRCKFSHCRYCSIKHNTLLHIERTDIPAVLDPLPSTSESVSLSANTLNLQPTTRTNVLLSTALVRVVNSAGKKYDARILLDNGSTANFISESLCNKLRLPRSDAYSKVTGINNQTSTSVQSCNLKIESLYDDYTVDIDCFILPEITRLLPSSRINIKDVVIPEGLKLADPSFHIPSVVDILVGADVFWSAIKPNHINLGKNQPKLCESKLGWLISGSVSYNSRSSRSHSCNLLNIECNNALSKFWELDSINEKHSLSLEERACEECFYKNITRKDDGRFVVTIPLKAEPSTLAQREMFPEEYALLKSGKALSHKNRLIALTPFIDGEDIIRVGGRLVNSHYEFDVKHPILLCGPQLLLANIRQTYWPLGGRNLARSTDKNVAAELAQEGIEFSFVPAYSPHFNGLAEAAVRSTKYHLKRLLTLTHLTYEELATCLTQIEAILNSRPLTPLSTNPLDLCALTPAHFLIGRSLMSVPTPQVTDTNICRLERYQRVEYLKQHFWRRFNLEYLSILQQKTKWATSSDSLAIGALVLIKDKALPPLCWSLGRVVQVYPGSDGINRVAELKTKRGTIRRAYNNICPLPIS